jgi:predicted  nucleic acid-binding Zn-ribbon protein
LIEPWEQMAAEARAEREAAARREAVAREDQDDALRRVVERDDEIERLRASLEQARQELAALRDQLRDAGSAGRSDVAGVRARALSFLKGRLRPSLETGREAAEAAQPNERVMRRMIIDTLYEVDREIEWLTSLD